ncbi:MAG TPA: EAL domain-containing protein [Devosiaceae bacterium]
MKSKYSHILMLVSAILAFVPVMAVDHLLDGYVRMREGAKLQSSVDALSAQTQAAAYDAINALRSILADSPSLCTPTFIENAHREMERSYYLRQVLVEGRDGVQMCEAYGSGFAFTPISAPLAIPGHTESITIVKSDGLKFPLIKVTQSFGANRTVSAFVPAAPGFAEGTPSGLPVSSFVRISLSDGTAIATSGDPSGFQNRTTDEAFISADGYAGELPIRVESAVPFAVVRAGYADLDVSFTIIACLMSGGFLALALQYVRQSNLPSVDLERAIVNGELKPYYQPVIDLSTGRLSGCEVLIRWVRKNGEIVPPGSFIDYAELSGLAIPMTLSLMQQVRNDLGELCTQIGPFKIGINLFAGHFLDGTIVEDVQAIFGGTPVDFRQLVFEITERRPLGNSLQANSVIAGLHSLGCRIAMDDAGTGHSNLAYLQTLGVDIIKIDRVFVDMVRQRGTPVPVLDALISIARDLGTEIIAEGVETEEQALYLRDRGVVMAQGFLFSRALPCDAFVRLARQLNRQRDPAPEHATEAA